MKLIIFDIDGTIADRDTHELLPGVSEWFRLNHHSAKYALCTNQGGVGLRYWMEHDGFGEPAKYPDEATARAHVQKVRDQLPLTDDIGVYICFAYQSQKTGMWSPTPAGHEHDPEWMQSYRKPAPGMLIAAMRDAGATPLETLFVGNDIEDVMAAKAARCSFVYAKQFFGAIAENHGSSQ